METDITQALKDTENSLRDFIVDVLEKADGSGWVRNCGLSSERLGKWEARKEEEQRRQRAGSVEPRLIYYADFYDLRTIITKRWEHFKEVFDDQKRLNVYLEDLERLRDPDAHRRELLPHQKHLVLGISGELRIRIIQHRNNLDSVDGYFPRIESARDSLGNIWIPTKLGKNVSASQILRVGDILDFTVTATDPCGAHLRYGYFLKLDASRIFWQDSREIQIAINEGHIGKGLIVSIVVMSPREYHAGSLWDDKVDFHYDVIPHR